MFMFALISKPGEQIEPPAKQRQSFLTSPVRKNLEDTKDSGMFLKRLAIHRTAVAFFAMLVTNSPAFSSALNLMQRNGEIALCADGGGYDRQARLVASAQKIIPVPLARSAVAVRGPADMIDALPVISIGVRSPAELLDSIKCWLEARRGLPADNPVVGERSAVLYVGGFTEAGVRKVWRITVAANQGEVAVEQLSQDSWQFSPAVSLGPAEIQLGLDDPAALCLVALEKQRKTAVTIPGWNQGRSAHIVGSDALFARITPDHIEMKLLKRWPDKFGQQISP